MSRRDSSDDYLHGVHSEEMDNHNDNNNTGAHRNNEFGASDHSQKGPRGPTDEDRDVVAKAIEAYNFLNNVANDHTSVLYPLISSVVKKKDALKFLEEVNQVKDTKEAERKEIQQKIEDLNSTHSLDKRKFKEERRRANQEYEKFQSEAERNKNIAIQQAVERHNQEMAKIQAEYNQTLSYAASKKYESFKSISERRKDNVREFHLKIQENNKEMKSIESYLVKVKEARAKIVFKCFFEEDAMAVLKTIAEAVQSHISSKNTKQSRKTPTPDIKIQSRIVEVDVRCDRRHPQERPPQTTHTEQGSSVFEEKYQRQKKREEERLKRKKEELAGSSETVFYNELNSIGNPYDSLLDSSEEIKNKSHKKQPPLPKAKNEPRRRSRQDRPSFLKKFSREKKKKNNNNNNNNRNTTPQNGESSGHSSIPAYPVNDAHIISPNPTLSDREHSDVEFVGGGVHQPTIPIGSSGDDVEVLVRQMQQKRKEGNTTDQIKRARFERELASCATPRSRAQLEQITQKEKGDAPSNNNQDKSSESTSFGQVLGAVVPYTGPVGRKETFNSSRLYGEYSSDSEEDDEGHGEYDSSEGEDAMYSSDLDEWGLSGNGSDPINNLFRQLAAGDLTGTQYEEMKESEKQYKSKVGDDFFKRNQYSKHGIIANPRMEDPYNRRKHKRKTKGNRRLFGNKGGRKKKRRKSISGGSGKGKKKPTPDELLSHPELYLDGLMNGRVTREDDMNPGCPPVLRDGKTIPSPYALQFSNVRETGPFPYFTATMIGRCGYCGLCLINCKCTCFLGHTREQCVNICYRGFHYTYEMAEAYANLLRSFNTGDDQTIRNAWIDWRKYRRDKLPDNMEKLEDAFIETFKWADQNGNLWRASAEDESGNHSGHSRSSLLAITDGSYHTHLDQYQTQASDSQHSILLQSAIMASSAGTFQFGEESVHCDPMAMQNPYIYNVWYSKACGSLDTKGDPTIKPPCHICGWPSILKKNDSFTFCSSCRNCQKIKPGFERWSKQSGVKGSNRGRKRAKSNLPQKRGTRKKIDSTRINLTSFGHPQDPSEDCMTEMENLLTMSGGVDTIRLIPEPVAENMEEKQMLLNSQWLCCPQTGETQQQQEHDNGGIGRALVPVQYPMETTGLHLDQPPLSFGPSSPTNFSGLLSRENSMTSTFGIGAEDERQGGYANLGEEDFCHIFSGINRGF